MGPVVVLDMLRDLKHKKRPAKRRSVFINSYDDLNSPDQDSYACGILQALSPQFDLRYPQVGFYT